MSSELEVIYDRVRHRPTPWYPDLCGIYLGPAWRICVARAGHDPSTSGVLLTAFARERDAIAARKALEAKGLITREALLAAGKDQVERTMAEAMCW